MDKLTLKPRKLIFGKSLTKINQNLTGMLMVIFYLDYSLNNLDKIISIFLTNPLN